MVHVELFRNYSLQTYLISRYKFAHKVLANNVIDILDMSSKYQYSKSVLNLPSPNFCPKPKFKTTNMNAHELRTTQPSLSKLVNRYCLTLHTSVFIKCVFNRYRGGHDMGTSECLCAQHFWNQETLRVHICACEVNQNVLIYVV